MNQHPTPNILLHNQKKKRKAVRRYLAMLTAKRIPPHTHFYQADIWIN